mgnify:CR=1 FL=1
MLQQILLLFNTNIKNSSNMNLLPGSPSLLLNIFQFPYSRLIPTSLASELSPLLDEHLGGAGHGGQGGVPVAEEGLGDGDHLPGLAAALAVLGGGVLAGERAVRVPGGGVVAVGAWVPGVRVLKVKFLQKKKRGVTRNSYS